MASFQAIPIAETWTQTATPSCTLAEDQVRHFPPKMIAHCTNLEYSVSTGGVVNCVIAEGGGRMRGRRTYITTALAEWAERTAV